MISPLSRSNFECIKCHFLFDASFFIHARIAGELITDLTNEGDRPEFSDTICPRLLLVAQSIVCCMALPFKIFVACIEGLDATIHSDTPFSLLKFVYAVASAGVYVIAIPTGLFLACQPTSWITNIQTARTILSSVNIPAELQLFAEQL